MAIVPQPGRNLILRLAIRQMVLCSCVRCVSLVIFHASRALNARQAFGTRLRAATNQLTFDEHYDTRGVSTVLSSGGKLGRLRQTKPGLGHQRACTAQRCLSLCRTEQAKSIVTCGLQRHKIAKLFAKVCVDPGEKFRGCLVILP